MDLRNCVKCNRVFAYSGSEVCTRCLGSDEDDFKKVKDYLYENPGANIIEVKEETGVEEKKILQFLRESRLEIMEEDNFFLDCERCGTPIRSGRFCNTCIADMQKEFTAAIKPAKEEIKQKNSGRRDTKMHIAEMRKKNR